MRWPRLQEVFDALPHEAVALVELLIERAERSGVTLYLVGGPVRDQLLGRAVLDVDLMVAGPEENAALALVEKLEAPDLEVRTHKRFGTLTVSAAGASVDVATLRSESYSHPGALPSVASGTLEEDLRRRDFSVNALALPLNGLGPRDEVPIIDLDDGLADLEARQLRVLHPRSFHDDPTRVLRAARLAPRLGFRLTRGTRSFLRDALRDGVFGSVSGDRLRREFEKLFSDAERGVNPAQCLARLEEWHVLQALEPGLGLPREAVAPLRRLGKLLAAPEWRVREHRPWVAGLCVWLAPLSPGLRRRVIKRLSVRGASATRIAGFPDDAKRWSRALARARGRGAADVVLAEIDEDRLLALYAQCEAPLRRRLVRWAAEDRDRRPPLGGADLLKAGLEGPAVGNALARVRAAWLDGEVANREEALALARELDRKGSRAPRRRRKQASRGGGR